MSDKQTDKQKQGPPSAGSMKKWVWAAVGAVAAVIAGVQFVRSRRRFDPARPSIAWGTTDLTIDEPERTRP